MSAQLYSAEEREQIHRVIGVMISYNLTFRQEKSIDGVYKYCFEPYALKFVIFVKFPKIYFSFLFCRDVEQVANFEIDIQRRNLTYSVKQMLSREIELEKLRQYESNLGPIIAKPVKQTEETMKPPSVHPAMLALKPKAIPESVKVSPSVASLTISLEDFIDESSPL